MRVLSKRFRTAEDSGEYMVTGDESLCIPMFITDQGGTFENPEYTNAKFEVLITEPEFG